MKLLLSITALIYLIINFTPSYAAVIEVCKNQGGETTYRVNKFSSHAKYERGKKGLAGCVTIKKSNNRQFYLDLLSSLRPIVSFSWTHVIKRNAFNSIESRYQNVEEIPEKSESPEPGDTTVIKTSTTTPTIEISNNITVYSQAYTIKGRIRGEGKKFYLLVNGEPTPVKTNGEFEFNRFNVNPDNIEDLRLVVIDQWNNRTEKNVRVTIKIDQIYKAAYEELNPTKINGYKSDNKVAIIIGIEKYIYLKNLEAPFANRDASAFREYTSRALGVKSSNIKLLLDNKASRPQILEAFKIWLPKVARGGKKDIYIFFAGHGLSSFDGKDLFILPHDGNSSLLSDTAITRNEVIKLIQNVEPKTVTMFFDTCYSGQTRDQQMLVSDLRPIIIQADKQDTPDNFTIFSASGSKQVSGSIKEAKHGIFSYFLMKGLEGNADVNNDKKITNGELIAFLKTEVGKEALSQNREQDPMLVGDSNKVIMKYR